MSAMQREQHVPTTHTHTCAHICTHICTHMHTQPVPTAKLLVSDSLSTLDGTDSVAHAVYARRSADRLLNKKLKRKEQWAQLTIGDDHPFQRKKSLVHVGLSSTPADDIFDGLTPGSVICEYRYSQPNKKWIFVRYRPDKQRANSVMTVQMVHYLTIRPLSLEALLAGNEFLITPKPE